MFMASHSPARSTVITPDQLKACAHPLRIALLEQLGWHGALTASQIAELVDESPSNCSWHLRRLAQAGLVERAEGQNRRDRPWQLTFDQYAFDANLNSITPDLLAHRQTDRMLTARRRRGGPPQTHATHAAWLTPAEAEAVMVHLEAARRAVEDATKNRTDPTQRPAEAIAYELVQWLVPVEGGA